jgi:V/A-type H+/Na+-transporting ATPase subunit A
VTVIGAVSPPGGDRTEPVTANTERFVRCVWSLDRDLAYARHYPAVSWTGSFSRDADDLGVWHTRQGDPGWATRRARVIGLLAEADRLAALADLVGVASLPSAERVVLLAARLLRRRVLQQNALSDNDASCSCGEGRRARRGGARCRRPLPHLVERGVLASTIEEQDYSRSCARARRPGRTTSLRSVSGGTG